MGGFMKDGIWFPKLDWETDTGGEFRRRQSKFHGRIGTAEHPADIGRYRLYVSYACPWAHRTLIVRALKGLEDAVPVTTVDPYMGDEGWAFRDDWGSPIGEPELGAHFLRQIYLAAAPTYSGRVTVPVLWDRVAATIVNNESREIMNMLDLELDRFATRDVDLYPAELQDQIEETIDAIYSPINNGVYRCGFAGTQAAYDRAFEELFDALAHWEQVLSRQRYLCGDRLTEADICMFTTLIRFDPVYYVHFKCNRHHIADLPNLGGFMREIFALPGVAEICRFDHIKPHYYRSHPAINPTGFVPGGPDLSYLAEPHGRDHLPARLPEALREPARAGRQTEEAPATL